MVCVFYGTVTGLALSTTAELVRAYQLLYHSDSVEDCLTAWRFARAVTIVNCIVLAIYYLIFFVILDPLSLYTPPTSPPANHDHDEATTVESRWIHPVKRLVQSSISSIACLQQVSRNVAHMSMLTPNSNRMSHLAFEIKKLSFENTDLVLSDIAAGLVLLKKYQTKEEKKRPIQTHLRKVKLR